MRGTVTPGTTDTMFTQCTLHEAVYDVALDQEKHNSDLIK